MSPMGACGRVWLASCTLIVACADDPDGRGASASGPGIGTPGLTAGATGDGDGDDGGDGGDAGDGDGDGDDAGDGGDESGGGDDSSPKFDLGVQPDGGTLPPTECETVLAGTVRDFQESHPDFEYVIAVDQGIVQSTLGADGKPVYASATTTPTTNGQTYFDQWYRDTAGVNFPMPLEISLTDQGDGTYTYDNSSFFPIDGQGFGNEGNPHNYHFTYEIRTKFTYEGGEVFTFRGDDDVWTFINHQLAIDLGGVHGAMESTIDLDAQAAALGIVPGGTYDLDFFFAERHTSLSNFRIETTIGCFEPPG